MELTATATNGYQFTGWSGNIVSTANPLTFAMNSPSTITANFSAAPTTIAFGSNVTGQITVSGSGCLAGMYTVPASIVWTNGTTCSVAVTSPHGGPDTRWVLANWTDGSTSNRSHVQSNQVGGGTPTCTYAISQGALEVSAGYNSSTLQLVASSLIARGRPLPTSAGLKSFRLRVREVSCFATPSIRSFPQWDDWRRLRLRVGV